MKIAFLSFGFLPNIGGAQIFTYNLIKLLSKRGHDVTLFLPYSVYKKYKLIGLNDEFKVFPILIFESFFLKYLPNILSISLNIWQFIKNYDLWQIILTYPAGYVGKSLYGKAPLFLTAFGDDIQKDSILKYGLRLNSNIEKCIIETLSFMDICIAITDTVKDCYLDLNVDKNKIVNIPMGVHLKRFNSSCNKNELRLKFKINDNETFILTTGRYHIKKGFEIIPIIAKSLLDRGIKFRWAVVGRGVDKLDHLIKSNNVDGYVILENEVGIEFENNQSRISSLPSKSLIQFYKSADIFVMTSLLETFGMVLIEAMAAGLPIISTDCPGCSDVIIDGQNGMLSPLNEPQIMADLIEKLINDKDLIIKLNNNVSNTIKYYDWNEIANRYENLYENTICKKLY